MGNQALGFAELLAGGLLLTAAVTGATLPDVATGNAGGPANLGANDAVASSSGDGVASASSGADGSASAADISPGGTPSGTSPVPHGAPGVRTQASPNGTPRLGRSIIVPLTAAGVARTMPIPGAQ